MTSDLIERMQEYLEDTIEKGRLGHAYLFIGSEYGRKKEIIEWFIGKIPHAERIDISPKIKEKGGISTIGIQDVRDAIEILSTSTFSGGNRCIVIEKADRLNKESSNALLKHLEEPPKGTVFILSVTHLSSVLPTIASRCQHIRIMDQREDTAELFKSKKETFDMLTQDTLPDMLMATKKLSMEDMDALDAYLHYMVKNRSEYADITHLYDRAIRAKRAYSLHVSERASLDQLFL